MKTAIRWAIAVCVLGIVLSGTAQVPEFINYQGRLTSPTGMPLVNDPTNAADGQIDLVFRLYAAETNGASVWSQTNSNVAVQNGLFSVLLGSVTNPLSPSYFPTNAGITRWLEVAVNGEPLSPRKELVSVAYAMNADMVDGKHWDQLGKTYAGKAPIVITDTNISLNYSGNDFKLTNGTLAVKDEGIDHGLLEGLADDDHKQYLNEERHALIDTNLEEQAPGDTTRGEPTKNEIRTWGQLDDGNPGEESPGYGIKGEPTRDEIESWGDRYDWDQDDHALIDHTAFEKDPQVDDAMTLNSIPRWDGGKLVTGSIYDAGGNVGIGMTNPAFTLDVNGSGNIRGPLIVTGRLDVGSDATVGDSLTVSNELKVVSDAIVGGRLTVTNELTAKSNVTVEGIFRVLTNQLWVMGTNIITNWPHANQVTNLNADMVDGKHASDIVADATNAFVEKDPLVKIRADNCVPKWSTASNALVTGNIYNDPIGNVGIGTPSPGYNLDIRDGPLGLVKTQTTPADFDNPTAITLALKDNNGYNAPAYIGYGKTGGRYDGYISFSTYRQADWNTHEWMRINQDGNVGIGTPTPGCKLDVNGDAVIRGPLYLSWGDDRIEAIVPEPRKPLLALYSWQSAINKHVTVLLTPDPRTDLGYDGEGFMVSGLQDSSPDMHVRPDGWVIARTYFHISSDNRVKINEQPFEYGLAQVMALEPKRYDRAASEFDPTTEELVFHPEKITITNEIGLVAQDVQKVIPEAVGIPEDENRQLWTLSYDTIIPVLVKAIQEQQAQIEALKEEVQALQSGPGRVRKNKRKHKKGFPFKKGNKKGNKMSRRGRAMQIPFHILTSVLSPTAMGRVIISMVVVYICFDSASSAQLAGGGYHSLALKENGTVWAWGFNHAGELGDGTDEDRYTPVQVERLTDVISVSAGTYHSLAVKEDGTVWAWGYNNHGQLGDGTDEDRYTPVQVLGLSGVIAFAGGEYHSLAVKEDGTVWAWGSNYRGVLGDGTETDHATPVQVVGLSEAIAISAGINHSLALKRDGTVWAWGYTSDGNTWGEHYTPVQVIGLTDVIAISRFLALKRDGTVWAWGGNLGDGSSSNSPVPVQSLVSGVIDIARGLSYSLALTSYGTVWFWGEIELDFSYHYIRSIIPIAINGISSVKAIADGGNHLLVLKNDGTVWTLGNNVFGQLGDGTTTTRTYPVQVQGLSLAASFVADYVLAADFDGDGRTDPFAANGSGQWCVWYSSQSYTRDGPYSLGISGTPVAGDADGDGQADMGIVQNGQWYIWLSGQSNAPSGPHAFGVSGSPVLADFDGDGKADPAMYEAASGKWQVWLSGSGYSEVSATFGVSGGTPVAGDFDGDGKADPVMVDGNGEWYFWLSGSYYIQSGPYNFGLTGKPIAGDFDGDGKADPAMMDASGNWYIWPSGSFYIPDGPYYLVLP